MKRSLLLLVMATLYGCGYSRPTSSAYRSPDTSCRQQYHRPARTRTPGFDAAKFLADSDAQFSDQLTDRPGSLVRSASQKELIQAQRRTRHMRLNNPTYARTPFPRTLRERLDMVADGADPNNPDHVRKVKERQAELIVNWTRRDILRAARRKGVKVHVKNTDKRPDPFDFLRKK